LRSAMTELLDIGLQRKVIAVQSLAELQTRSTEALSCGFALLDVNLGGDDAGGLDAFHWLKGQGFGGRVIFMTGHARTHPMVTRAMQAGVAQVVEKPVTGTELRHLLEYRDG
jgi:FixJ family two-component response regulator